MALYPGALLRLIPPGANDPRITPRAVILHVAVSEGDSLHDYFANRSGGIESHFYVLHDGTVEQYRDTGWQADAQLYTEAVSIETQGMGAGTWTPAALASLKRLILWLHDVHDIPLVPIDEPRGAGVSYHSRFREWSPVTKSCPGPDRIRQYNDVLVPWMAGQNEEDDMPTAEEIAKAVVKELLDAVVDSSTAAGGKRKVRGMLTSTERLAAAAARAAGAVQADLADEEC